MECIDCKNKFKTKESLSHHRKTAKYCLKLRGENAEINGIKCSGCNKNFTRKYTLKRHQINCNLKKEHKQIKEEKQELKNENKMLKQDVLNKDVLIVKLETQVLNLQKQIVEISMKAVSRPINNTNNNINQKILNLIPITDNHFEEQACHLNLEHIKNGAEGYAKYAVEYPLKGRALCSDFSRRKIKYKDKDGNVLVDPEMSKISQNLFKAIESKNDELISSYITELQQQLFNINTNSSSDMDEKESERFGGEANDLIDFITNMASQRREIKDAAKGIKGDMYYNILKNICSMMV